MRAARCVYRKAILSIATSGAILQRRLGLNLIQYSLWVSMSFGYVMKGIHIKLYFVLRFLLCTYQKTNKLMHFPFCLRLKVCDVEIGRVGRGRRGRETYQRIEKQNN